ncbi:lipopolysaccharide biosynthesis protein [Flaviaesturariibacter amylovorans]|uniref:Polysaccharide biosynthesis C-terminal domain-containing protein n=1 Tax=Flaviaesturariibacter amylovorans TaxID=1084520 RepID=A0ABP8GBN4_9BACT
MLKHFKQLAGDSLIYGLSSVIAGLISLFLVPVYARIFTPADYGIVNLVNVTFFLLTILVVFGLDAAVAVWFWEHPEEQERRSTFASWFWFQLGAAGLFGALIFLSAPLLSRAVLSRPDLGYLFRIMAVNLPFVTTHRLLINWYKYGRKPVPTVIFTLLVSLTMIGASIVLVAWLRIGVSGVFWAQLLSSVLGAAIVLARMGSWLSVRHFSRERLRAMLRFSAPLVPAALSFWALGNAGSYALEHLSAQRTTEVGLYQIGVTFAGLVNIIVMAFNQAWAPFALSIARQPDHRQVYAQVFLVYITAGSVAAAGLWIFAPEVLRLFTTAPYYPAAGVVGILGCNVFLMGIANITTIGCNLARTNKPYAHAVGIASVLTVALYFALVPPLGRAGAAWATLAGSVALNIYIARAAQRLYPVPYNWTRAGGLLAVAAGAVLLAAPGVNGLEGTGLLAAKMAIFALLIAAAGLLNRGTLRRLAAAFRARRATGNPAAEPASAATDP